MHFVLSSHRTVLIDGGLINYLTVAVLIIVLISNDTVICLRIRYLCVAFSRFARRFFIYGGVLYDESFFIMFIHHVNYKYILFPFISVYIDL